MNISFYLLLVGEDVDSGDPRGSVVIGSTGSTLEVENCLDDGNISFFSVTATTKNTKMRITD